MDHVGIAIGGQVEPKANIPLQFIETLPQRNVGIAIAAPLQQGSGTLQIAGAEIPVVVLATTPSFYDIVRANIQHGRRTYNLDDGTSHAIIGSEVAMALTRITGKAAAVGDQIRLDDHMLSIVGILQPTFPSAVLGLDFNQAIVVPFGSGRLLMAAGPVSSIAARLAPGADDEQTSDMVKNLLEQLTGPGTVRVQTARQLLDNLDEQMQIYSRLILGISLISLIVGGSGIMSVMLMNVAERRQEIGLKRAVGARKSDILIGFLVEAMVLSSIGSAIGVLIGTGAGWAFAASAGWQFTPTWAALPAGLLMAILFAIVFGSFPAYQATRYDPIQSIRAN